MRSDHFYAPPDFQCPSVWEQEWDSCVEWDGSDFEDTLSVIGIFCDHCGEAIITEKAQ